MIIEPKYQVITQSDTTFTLCCHFSNDYPYFAGHFPNFPILAGVVQLGLVHQFVQKFLSISLSKATIRQIKYQRIVPSNSTLHLQVDYMPEKKRLDFKWLQKDECMSSGVFSL
ncbi:hypothetical protein [Gallibacterium salpingitidis]|uniref:ApeI family dehydratase n=1 Tax=Gallibacterium salpingitidis TaxID=505341 RepID=UPI000825AFBC|nr:hypothetical protein [Gallibacterium salpingitidis]WKS99407.1 hypothetical protein NYR30_11925 [Gallibacterium salpingitidis]